jgi:nicotinamidase-related amidase
VLDPTHTALLVTDRRPASLAFVPDGEDHDALLGRVAGAVADVREGGGTIAYVRVGFTDADNQEPPPHSVWRRLSADPAAARRHLDADLLVDADLPKVSLRGRCRASGTCVPLRTA